MTVSDPETRGRRQLGLIGVTSLLCLARTHTQRFGSSSTGGRRGKLAC